MDSKELKQYIYKNDKVDFILEKLGMHNIKHRKEYFSCSYPDGDNPNGCLVYTNEYLNIWSNTRNITNPQGFTPDIIDLVQFIIKTKKPIEAMNWLCNILNLHVSLDKKAKEKNDVLDLYKKINRKNKKVKTDTTKEYDLSILDWLDKTPHIDLIRKDWIFQNMIDKYSIGFDYQTDRIIFPHFKYNDKNTILALIGRTVIPAYKELNIPKYMTIIGEGYEKNKNLYGLSHNIEEIKKAGKVIVFEAEKSVIKADECGYPIGVSVGCHEISDEQLKMLISLNVEIMIAFDKDVEEEHILSYCNIIKKYRKVSYIYDKYKLLREKDSPIDRGKKKFDFLFKHRIKL